jgi:hypothetical protein
MILRIVLMLLPITVLLSQFDTSGFYAVMANGHLADIKAELDSIRVSHIPEKGAYTGTLLMKEAGMLTFPKDKLSTFKEGHTLLEAAITKDSTNVEYHFLRLCIEENAPKFLKYHADLDKDNLYIHLHFKLLSPVVQQAVKDYSKHSRVLRTENL